MFSIDQALQKGIKAHRAGRFQEADRFYTLILKEQPKHPDANHNMGILAVELGKFEPALPFFKSALVAKPNIAHFWLSYIDTLLKLGRMVDAKAVFNKAKSNGAKGIGFDQLEEKLKDIKTSANASSSFHEPPPDLLQNLVNLYSQGQVKEAIIEASQALLKAPASVNLYNFIGVANQKLGKLEEAIEAFNKALSIKPDYAEAYYNIGITLKKKGKLDEAVKAYNKAVFIKPDYAQAYNNMGNALTEQGNLEEAIEAFNKALSIKPDYAKAYYSLGTAFMEQCNLEKAIAAYKKAVTLKPDYAQAYNNMGIALKEQGKLGEAIDTYTKALSFRPDYAEVYNNMGNALEKKGDFEEAIQAYNKALRIKPDYVLAYNSLAVALIGQGKLDEAITCCENALSIQPNYAQVTHILSSLTGKTTNSAPRDYVENLFNSCANEFDRELVNKLKYNIPKKIAELAVRDNESLSLGSILDLGCGSGLSGVELRRFSSNLEGIDISNKMLERAKKKDVYDKLSHVDIVDYLENTELDFDYFISADVFVYVGELSQVFRLIKSKNKKPGKLIFSTEHNEKNSFYLEKSGRYSHSKSYIEDLCKKFGYTLSHFSETNLRKEKGRFLSGAIYLLDF